MAMGLVVAMVEGLLVVALFLGLRTAFVCTKEWGGWVGGGGVCSWLNNT